MKNKDKAEEVALNSDDLNVIEQGVKADLEAMGSPTVAVIDELHPARPCRAVLEEIHRKKRFRELAEIKAAKEETERSHNDKIKVAEQEVAKLYGREYVINVGENRLEAFEHASDVRCPCGEPILGMEDAIFEAWRFRKTAIEGVFPNRLPRENTILNACAKCGTAILVSIQVRA